MHRLSETKTWDPFPPSRHVEDGAHRRDANRAVGFSALGLGLAGMIELVLALFSGSVGLLADALHNLSDVSTSAVVFIGFSCPGDRPRQLIPMGLTEPRTLRVWG
jgi:divalent metal cation (Fe/Co/Zn/Cd) transporter